MPDPPNSQGVGCLHPCNAAKGVAAAAGCAAHVPAGGVQWGWEGGVGLCSGVARGGSGEELCSGVQAQPVQVGQRLKAGCSGVGGRRG